MLGSEQRRLATEAFEEARARGFLGPGPVEPHLDHSLALAAVIGAPPVSLVDLGSGGGVPGLVLAVLWPETRCLLLESQQRRARFLETWSERLAPSNCTVLRARAEEAGRDRRWREQADVVAARAFGPPAVTAECGAPFLRIGGRLLVSEPPEGEAGRWPTAELARLGLGPAERVEGGGASAVLIDKVRALHERWPRRPGIPNKRPLW